MYIDRTLCDMAYKQSKFGKEIHPVYEQFKWQYPQYGAQEAIPRVSADRGGACFVSTLR